MKTQLFILNISLFLFNFSSINAKNNVTEFKNDAINYEQVVTDIIHQVVALKEQYPKQLSKIENATVERQITASDFWTRWHYDKGLKWVSNPNYKKDKKSSQKIKAFSKNGIEIQLYFYKGNWSRQNMVSPISLGEPNIVIEINNDKTDLRQNIEEIIIAKREELKLNTLSVGHTYWWKDAGPFIGLCGDKYAFVFLGGAKETNTGTLKAGSSYYNPQEGIIEINEILKKENLRKVKYTYQQYFFSACFYNTELKKGDEVMVFCYKYKGAFCVLSQKSILKEKEDPAVLSVKKYIKNNQNPIAIKEDVLLWEKRGFGNQLKKII